MKCGNLREAAISKIDRKRKCAFSPTKVVEKKELVEFAIFWPHTHNKHYNTHFALKLFTKRRSTCLNHTRKVMMIFDGNLRNASSKNPAQIFYLIGHRWIFSPFPFRSLSPSRSILAHNEFTKLIQFSFFFFQIRKLQDRVSKSKEQVARTKDQYELCLQVKKSFLIWWWIFFHKIYGKLDSWYRRGMDVVFSINCSDMRGFRVKKRQH